MPDGCDLSEVSNRTRICNWRVESKSRFPIWTSTDLGSKLDVETPPTGVENGMLAEINLGTPTSLSYLRQFCMLCILPSLTL